MSFFFFGACRWGRKALIPQDFSTILNNIAVKIGFIYGENVNPPLIQLKHMLSMKANNHHL